MANQEQLERLKQGVEAWNRWRKENPRVMIDLTEADLVGVNLYNVYLGGVYPEIHKIISNPDRPQYYGDDLSRADLSNANLVRAVLVGINLSNTILNGANLSHAYLRGANFRKANLLKTSFEGASLAGADIRGANLNGADLREVDLRGAQLSGADFSKVGFGATVLGLIDLSETKGLDEVIHEDPSQISTDSLQLSKGKIPKKFLRGCGLSDWEIESTKLYQPGLSKQEVNDILYRIYDLRAGRAIQINPLFISYSHKDRAFVDEIEKHLDEKSIRFWRDIHDATAGRLEKVVDRAMRLNPIVLLILSENSVKSDWVEHEARTARELEKELGRDVLCPLALDDAWKKCRWPKRLRVQIMEYNILDFSKWEDEQEFEKMFRKLIDGLDLFYKEDGGRKTGERGMGDGK